MYRQYKKPPYQSNKSSSSKAPLCKFYQRGQCSKGEACSFKHVDYVSDQDKVLCSYHIQGTCRYNEHCQYVHGNVCEYCTKPCLHPFNEKQAAAHTKLCKTRTMLLGSLPPDVAELTAKVECGICLEVVMEKGKRFGLMTECDHSFCLNCIRAWRSKNRDVSNSSVMVKACPTCRKESLYVIPSPVFCVGEFKQTMISQYKNNMKNTPCKYYDRSQNCPFGADCFFAHLDESGCEVDSSSMRNKVKNRQQPQGNGYPFAPNIIDLLSHVTNLHPSNVMDLLMDLLVEEDFDPFN